ncbi:MAG TPA: hypothetical protein VF718_14840 [Allosphingosinicella sp.]|jgi:hypothetical protein
MTRAPHALLGGWLVLAAWAASPAEARSVRPCAISFTASADGSFAQAGYSSTPARLSRLAAATRERFTAAALRLCAARVLTPADLARFGRLVVQNGEGATEPLVYQDPQMGPRVFIFQYAFQEGDPPDAAAFEQALRCWKRPKSCDFGD